MAMNQRKVSGETTLDALQRAYQATAYRLKALAICADLDRGCDRASGEAKRRALALAQTVLKRC
jgi:hypothetical protein